MRYDNDGNMNFTVITPAQIKFLSTVTRTRGNHTCIEQWYAPTGYPPIHTRQELHMASNIVESEHSYSFLCNGRPAILYKPNQKRAFIPPNPPPGTEYVFMFHKNLCASTPPDAKVFVWHREDANFNPNPMSTLFYTTPAPPPLPLPEKRAFCVWYSPDISVRELTHPIRVSLTSFLQHNPDFTLYFYTNVPFTGIPDGVVVVPFTPNEFPFRDGHLAHFADYLRLKLLYEYGGLYFDCADTFTTGSFADIYSSHPEKLVWSSCHTDPKAFSTGCFFVRKPKNPLIKHILLSFQNDYRPNSYSYNMEIATRSIVQDFPDDQFCIPYTYWFPHHIDKPPADPYPLFPETLQIHLYASMRKGKLHPWYAILK